MAVTTKKACRICTKDSPSKMQPAWTGPGVFYEVTGYRVLCSGRFFCKKRLARWLRIVMLGSSL